MIYSSWYSVRIVERDRNGKPIHSAGTHIDLDERKLDEESLKEKEERFHGPVQLQRKGGTRFCIKFPAVKNGKIDN